MAAGDSVDELVSSTFKALQSAASSLSELYAAGTEQHRRAFRAGAFNELERLHEWLWQHQGHVTVGDVVGYVQNAMNYNASDAHPPAPVGIRPRYPQNMANAEMPIVSPYVPRYYGDLNSDVVTQQPSSIPSANFCGGSSSQVSHLGADVGGYNPDNNSSFTHNDEGNARQQFYQ